MFNAMLREKPYLN